VACLRQPNDVKAIDYATQHLAIAPSTGGEAKVLTASFDRSVRRPRFSSDGHSIFFIAEDDGTQSLCRIAVTGGEVARPSAAVSPSRPIRSAKMTLSPRKSPTLDRPEEIFFLGGKDLTRLTKHQ